MIAPVRHHPIISLADGVGYNVPGDVMEYILEDMKGDLELYLYFDFMDHKERLSKVHRRLHELTHKPIILKCIPKANPKPLSIKILPSPPGKRKRDDNETKKHSWLTPKKFKPIVWYEQKPQTWTKPLGDDNWIFRRIFFGCNINSRLARAPYQIIRGNLSIGDWEEANMKSFETYKEFKKHYEIWSEEEWKLLKGIYFYCN